MGLGVDEPTCFFFFFIQLLNRHLLNACFVPDDTLGSGF